MDELKGLSKKLNDLLIDAQPGLVVWRMCLNTVLLELSMFCGTSSVIEAAKKELGGRVLMHPVAKDEE